MCHDNMNNNSTVAHCEACEGDIDIDGDSTDVCGYSAIDCEVCGAAPCNESC
jgi:hypothetical protein